MCVHVYICAITQKKRADTVDMDCHSMFGELQGMLVGPIREALRVRGMCDEALKRSKIVLREDLRVMLQKEIAMSQSHDTIVSASIGVSSAKGGVGGTV